MTLRPTCVTSRWRRANRQCSFALPRACATEMIRRNANPRHVKELLGHEDFRSLDVYAKLAILDLKAAHRKYHPREQREGDDPEEAAGAVPARR